jgi:hypothetical protein
MKEMMVSGYSKTTGISGLKGAGYFSESLESTPWATVASAVGETAELFAEEVGAPVGAVATSSQIGVHLGCTIAR